MIRALVFAAALLPGAAHAYTVTLGAPPLGEAPSRFEERAFPASRFTPKPQESEEKEVPQTSVFELKQLDPDTRRKTESTLRDLGARQDGKRIIVSLPADVLFDFDKHHIRADARPVLARLSEVLIALPDAPVAIIGHTDSKGSDAYNDRLSRRRAEQVRDWLARLGVDEMRVTTSGKGEKASVAPNTHPDGSDDPAGRQKNRRVEFVIESGD